MIIIVSPSKRLDFETKNTVSKHTVPSFLDKSAQLVEELRQISPSGLKVLMNVSEGIARLTYKWYSQWEAPFNNENAHQALLTFKGDVYRSMDPESFSAEDLDFAHEHLRILSGLYGILRPLDLIQPYRLEMGTKLPIGRKIDLYEFWSASITSSINQDMKEQKEQVLVNLASREYFDAVDTGKIGGKLVTPVFREYRNDKYKVIGILAKKARGMMTRYIIRNRLEEAEDIKSFNEHGYRYDDNLSTSVEWTFTR